MRLIKGMVATVLIILVVTAVLAGCSTSSPALTSVSLFPSGSTVTLSTVIPVTTGATGNEPQIGKPAPDFSYIDNEGGNVSLSSLKGKTVIINFWATWCEPCRQEMPLLQELTGDKELAAQEVVLLTINDGESADAVNSFLRVYGYSFTVLLDPRSAVGRIYNIRYLPTTYFIGADGLINYVQYGAFENLSQIEQLLNSMMK